MPASRVVAVLLAAVAAASGAQRSARADGMVVVGGSPRSIGRAGADEVGDDGGGALLVDPAALARRDVARAQVGVAYIADDLSWQSNDSNAPVAHGQGGSIAMPMVGLQIPVGDWMLGAAAMTAAVSRRSLTRPNVPPTAYGDLFQYRYAGLDGGVRRDTATIGAAHRLGDEIAVGAAVGVSRILVNETRDLWAGFAGILPPGDPRADVTLAMTGEDRFAPNAVVGALFAPNDTSLELAASVSWAGAANLAGNVSSTGATGGPMTIVTSPAAHMTLPQPWTLRGGARYAGERWIAECDGDLWVFPSHASDEVWTIDGLAIESNNVTGALPSVRSRLSPRTHGAVRGALDVALLPGFLWATAGYAYTTRGTGEAELSPTFADLGGHTVALGIEANAGGFTLTIGASRTWSTSADPGSTAFSLDNPFNAGNAAIPIGIYGGTIDQVGLMLDAELGARSERADARRHPLDAAEDRDHDQHQVTDDEEAGVAHATCTSTGRARPNRATLQRRARRNRLPGNGVSQATPGQVRLLLLRRGDRFAGLVAIGGGRLADGIVDLDERAVDRADRGA